MSSIGVGKRPRATLGQCNGRGGFTLIELLVVIAIIAIMAAILFPVFARARESAKRSSCLSNMKQMGLAEMQYTQDFDEYYTSAALALPAGSSPDGACTAANGSVPWGDLLQPYLQNFDVFICPDADYYKNPFRPNGESPVTDPCTCYFWSTSYGYNLALGDPFGGHPSVQTVAIPTPADVMMIAEDADNSANSNIGQHGYYELSPDWANPGMRGSYPLQDSSGNYWWTVAYSSQSGSGNGRLVGRHFNGANIVYCDGHAKFQAFPGALTNSNGGQWTIH